MGGGGREGREGGGRERREGGFRSGRDVLEAKCFVVKKNPKFRQNIYLFFCRFTLTRATSQF